MTEEITWSNISEIILQYRILDRTQGFKVYFKTVDYDTSREDFYYRLDGLVEKKEKQPV